MRYDHSGDLKDYKAPSFYLLTAEQAGKALLWVVAIALVLERLGLL